MKSTGGAVDPADVEEAPVELAAWLGREDEDPLKVIERDVLGLMREVAEAKAALATEQASGKEGLKRLLVGLLEACDAFERVFDHVEAKKEEESKRLEPHVLAWLGSFKTTYKLLLRLLKQAGVTRVETGGVFDPHRHRVLDVKQQDGVPDGTVVDTVLGGYLWNGELLRKAEVVVVGSDLPDASPP